MRLTKQIIHRLLAHKISDEIALEQFREIVAKSFCPSEWETAYRWVNQLEPEVKFRREHPNLFIKKGVINI